MLAHDEHGDVLLRKGVQQAAAPTDDTRGPVVYNGNNCIYISYDYII